MLTRLGYAPEDGGWRVPTWRAGDTTREIDLVEEVARVDGVWKVPTVMPPHADAVGRWRRTCGSAGGWWTCCSAPGCRSR